MPSTSKTEKFSIRFRVEREGRRLSVDMSPANSSSGSECEAEDESRGVLIIVSAVSREDFEVVREGVGGLGAIVELDSGDVEDIAMTLNLVLRDFVRSSRTLLREWELLSLDDCAQIYVFCKDTKTTQIINNITNKSKKNKGEKNSRSQIKPLARPRERGVWKSEHPSLAHAASLNTV